MYNSRHPLEHHGYGGKYGYGGSPTKTDYERQQEINIPIVTEPTISTIHSSNEVATISSDTQLVGEESYQDNGNCINSWCIMS